MNKRLGRIILGVGLALESLAIGTATYSKSQIEKVEERNPVVKQISELENDINKLENAYIPRLAEELGELKVRYDTLLSQSPNNEDYSKFKRYNALSGYSFGAGFLIGMPLIATGLALVAKNEFGGRE